jgi:hypothetical protein
MYLSGSYSIPTTYVIVGVCLAGNASALAQYRWVVPVFLSRCTKAVIWFQHTT